MQVPVVMTVIGTDRPGIVEAVARVVAEHGGNWLESRMCRLGGQFAGILRAQVPPDRRLALCDALKAMAASSLTIVVEQDEAASSGPPGGLAVIELLGHDRPGIIREISAALARQRINVEELTTEVVSAPMSGEPLFKARATVTAPADADLAPLRRQLEKIAADLQVDIAIHSTTVTPA